MESLEERGIDTSRLLLSGNAHLIMPYHLELDRVTERRLGKNRLGTTKRGIGPAYADKATRIGLRVQDLLDPKIFSREADGCAEGEEPPAHARVRATSAGAERDRRGVPRIRGAARAPHHRHIAVVQRALDDGKTVLFEGAQATMLDLDHGTYPFVTSSNPIAGGAASGAEWGRGTSTRSRHLEGLLHAGRIGSVPFGSRPRRGRDPGRGGRRIRNDHGPQAAVWLVRCRRRSLRRSAQHADGARHHETRRPVAFRGIKVCVAYEYEGERYERFPPNQTIFNKCRPVYETLPGWSEDITEATDVSDLPAAAKDYLLRLEELVRTPISWASVGAGRAQMVHFPDGIQSGSAPASTSR